MITSAPTSSPTRQWVRRLDFIVGFIVLSIAYSALLVGVRYFFF